MTAAEAVIHLRKENQELREALKQTQELRQVALARIEELENQQTPPPALVKADVKKPAAEEKQPRKKRAAQHKHARRRAVPTQMVEHHRVCCPDCDLRVGAVRVVRRRDVIDLPAPIAMHIPEHRIFKGGWARCQTWHEAPVDLSAEVLGPGRIGVRLSSRSASLRPSLRLPFRQRRAPAWRRHQRGRDRRGGAPPACLRAACPGGTQSRDRREPSGASR